MDWVVNAALKQYRYCKEGTDSTIDDCTPLPRLGVAHQIPIKVNVLATDQDTTIGGDIAG